MISSCIVLSWNEILINPFCPVDLRCPDGSVRYLWCCVAHSDGLLVQRPCAPSREKEYCVQNVLELRPRSERCMRSYLLNHLLCTLSPPHSLCLLLLLIFPFPPPPPPPHPLSSSPSPPPPLSSPPHLLPSLSTDHKQFWIGAVIILGFLEKTFFVSEYTSVNIGENRKSAV